MTSLLRRGNKTVSKDMAYERENVINSILWILRVCNTMPIVQYYVHSNSIEPLEMKHMFPVIMNTIEILKEYEKRCFVMHQRLRTDRRCHFKLRSYVQSFKLDRESFIRHMMLYCFKIENEIYGSTLTLIFFRECGWANEMIAYENIMQIGAEALQIALMNIESFSKNTFIMLLHSIIDFSERMASFMPENQEEIRRILPKTLSSIKNIIGEQRYKLMYAFLLKYIYDGNLSYLIGKYNEISEWIYALIHGYVPCTISLIDCTCDKCSYCKRQSFFKNKIAMMYNAYLFICECIKISTNFHRYYYERLLRNLCLE
ncbi:PREDICTED: uncharacterized protein LOC108770397 [Trachymyrmex cornetzi]|uniref:uncharacterized protein LOC108770397 n=1 Tax=Trachymyrmex cornetzi TaxID=471704 RepID=UPI00084F71E2|nr:PREDICTED: uncharacterized protein LOC108770397 [Trachymyrmex cornetzi]